MKLSFIKNVFVFPFLLFFSGADVTALAYTLSNGKNIFCDVTWKGKNIRVAEEYLGRVEGRTGPPVLGGSAAIIKYPVNEDPVIVFDVGVMYDVAQLLPLATDFIFFHECAHIRYDTSDEFYTNCRAVVDMYDAGHLDQKQFFLIEKYHHSMSRLPIKYGGAGFVFWEKTKRCLRKINHPLVSHDM